MRRKNYFFWGMLCVFLVLFLVPTILAQTAPGGTPAPAPSTMDLATRVVGLAGGVAVFLQGIKQYVPVSGIVAKIFAFVIAAAGAVATAPQGQVLSISTAGIALAAGLSANGIHSFFKTASGQSTSAGG